LDKYPKPGLVIVIPLTVVPIPIEAVNAAAIGLVFSIINASKVSSAFPVPFS